MMRRQSSRPLTLGMLCLVMSATARADDPGVSATAVLTAASGAEVYAHICQGCHMADGKGAVGAGRYPALASDPALISWQFVALTVLQGRNAMPPFGHASGGGGPFGVPRLSDEQIAAVINYVRSHFGNHYGDRVSAAQVAALPHSALPADKR